MWIFIKTKMSFICMYSLYFKNSTVNNTKCINYVLILTKYTNIPIIPEDYSSKINPL